MNSQSSFMIFAAEPVMMVFGQVPIFSAYLRIISCRVLTAE